MATEHRHVIAHSLVLHTPISMYIIMLPWLIHAVMARMVF